MRKIGEREGVSQRNGWAWKIAEYLLEVPGQYPRHINFRVSDGQTGRIAHFDSLVSKTVTVSFDIDAHEYEGRWFNEINAWGVMEYVAGRKIAHTQFAPEHAPQPADGGTGAAPAAGEPTTGNAPSPQPQGTGDSNQEGGKADDLPF